MANVLKIAKGQGILLAGNMVNRGLDFAIITWLTYNLGLETFGQFTAVYIYYSFWSLLTELGMAGVVTREAARDPRRALHWAGNAWLVSLLGVALIIPAALAGTRWYFAAGDFPGSDIQVLALVTSVAVLCSSKFLTFRKVADSLFAANHRFGYVTLFDISERLVFLAGFGLAPDRSLFWALACFATAGLPGLLGAFILHGRMFGWPQLKPRADILTPLLSAALLSFIGGALFLLNFKIDVLMLFASRSTVNFRDRTGSIGIIITGPRNPSTSGILDAA